jgi:hypothetical protein
MKLEGKKKETWRYATAVCFKCERKKNYDWFRMGGVTIFISTV